MHLQIITTKINSKHKLTIILNCRKDIYNYNISLETLTIFNAYPAAEGQCTFTILKHTNRYLISTTEVLWDSIIEDVAIRGSKILDHYIIHWFNVHHGKEKVIRLDHIKCISKYNSKFFKDLLKLDICPDGGSCIAKELSFEKPKKIEFKDVIMFYEFIFIRLWSIEYGMKNSLSFIGENTFDNDHTAPISFKHGAGLYNLTLDLEV